MTKQQRPRQLITTAKQEELPQNFPYQRDATFTIEEHIPPQPFGPRTHFDYYRPQIDEPHGCTALEWCLKYPLDDPEPIEDPYTYTLHILDQVACGTKRAAQVMRCYLNNRKDKVYIAKFFDPLYTTTDCGDFTYDADHNYAFEAGAYRDISDAGLDGRYTPSFYGAWKIHLPVTDSDLATTRSVRMVLLEEIHGRSIVSLLREGKTSRVPPADRLAILAEIFEIYVRLEFAGIVHRDLEPRNVMLSGLDFDDPTAEYTKPRVVFIDFNVCELLQRRESFYTDARPKKPLDPKVEFGAYCPPEWRGWAPSPHCLNDAAWRGWIRKLWNSDEFRKDKGRILTFDDKREFIEVEPEPDE